MFITVCVGTVLLPLCCPLFLTVTGFCVRGRAAGEPHSAAPCAEAPVVLDRLCVRRSTWKSGPVCCDRRVLHAQEAAHSGVLAPLVSHFVIALSPGLFAVLLAVASFVLVPLLPYRSDVFMDALDVVNGCVRVPAPAG